MYCGVRGVKQDIPKRVMHACMHACMRSNECLKIFLSLSHAVIKYKQKGEESECFNHYVEIVNNIFNVTNTL